MNDKVFGGLVENNKNSLLTHILAGLLNVFERIRWKHGCDPSLLCAPGWRQKLQLERLRNNRFDMPAMNVGSLGVWFEQDLVFELLAFA